MQGIRKIQFLFKGYRNFTKRDKPFPVLEGTLEGVNYVITGANSGIGFNAAKYAASKGAKVFLVCRNPKRGQDALKKIKAETHSDKVHLILGEMGEIKQLNKVFQEIKEKVGRIDVFVHNAGCMINQKQYTSDKLEKNFATNTLSIYYLTKKCIPFLHQKSRVIVVSSGGMYTEKLVTDDINMDNQKKFDGTSQYAKNKRQQVCMIEQFAKAYPNKGKFITMHPGWVDTQAVRTSMPDFHKKFKDDLRSQDQGADTINYLSICPFENIENGAFYFDRKSADKHLTVSSTEYKQADADKLMKKLQQISGF